ncbi:MAG: tRNA 2-thiouridine(34) synthase MnmA [Patescibacteria group bacterium]
MNLSFSSRPKRLLKNPIYKAEQNEDSSRTQAYDESPSDSDNAVDRGISGVSGKRVFVGLSGGVDSAVSAALMQKAGAAVTGVFIKGWYPPGMPCTWAQERRDAMRVAAYLRIPFRTLDASKEYKAGVIDYLLREYKAGRTPNPDIMCNRDVKFGAFYAYAMQEGADYIATGHYAEIRRDEKGVHLLRGADATKDQSYFLWAVPKETLAQTLFPVGGMPKASVRAQARALRLPNAAKPDSQGICFLGTVSVEDFLRKEFGSTPGKALSVDGTEVGTHDGVVLRTLGERVALADAPPGPWYVLRKDMETNTLTVSHDREEESAEAKQSIQLLDSNFFTEPRPDMPLEAQYRYHGPRISGTFVNGVFTASVPLREAVASGQSLVLYLGEECIGGGSIK